MQLELAEVHRELTTTRAELDSMKRSALQSKELFF